MIVIHSMWEDSTGPEDFSHMLQKSLEDHLARCEVEAAELTLTIHEFLDSKKCKLSVRLDGNIDGTNFSETISSVRSDSTVDGATNSVGCLAGLAISIFTNVLSERFSKSRVSSKMSQCADECLGQLKQKINNIKGIASTFAERAHTGVFAFSILAALTVLARVILGSLQEPGYGVVVGAILSLIVFAVFYCSGLVFLPTDFYKNSPKGQVVMAKTGFGSVIVLRVVCAIALPIAFLLLYEFSLVVFDSLRQHFFLNWHLF